MRRRDVLRAAAVTTGLVASSPFVPGIASAVETRGRRPLHSTPVATGTGGAVSTVDPRASATGIEVLRAGGNAVDAAVAAAAVLNVVLPSSSGVGGAGFFVVYLAAEDRVVTVNSGALSPAAFDRDAMLEGGEPIPIDEYETSGLIVAAPGTVLGWQQAVRRYGRWTLGRVLRPAIGYAADGFEAHPRYVEHTERNAERFRDLTSSSEYYLVRGRVPEVGETIRNPDLAETLRLVAEHGARAFYTGPVARDIIRTVRHPPVRPGAGRTVRPGLLTMRDLREYRTELLAPTHVRFLGNDVYGMGPPSSGALTQGEALNLLEHLPRSTREEAFHYFVEAMSLAWADRLAYVGDAHHVDVPVHGMLSKEYAADRRKLVGTTAAEKPVDAGDPFAYQDGEGRPGPAGGSAGSKLPESTTHLSVVDGDGNIVAFTTTIDSWGGSGIAVPGRGFLLNNWLGFDLTPGSPDAPAPRKSPRSGMSPTIVMRDGEPVLVVGTPGGKPIVTTIGQILYDRLALGSTLADAVWAPRLSPQNKDTGVEAETEFISSPTRAALEARGHRFTLEPEMCHATGVELLPDGRLRAVAEARRDHGGSAMVVDPSP